MPAPPYSATAPGVTSDSDGPGNYCIDLGIHVNELEKLVTSTHVPISAKVPVRLDIELNSALASGPGTRLAHYGTGPPRPGSDRGNATMTVTVKAATRNRRKVIMTRRGEQGWELLVVWWTGMRRGVCHLG